uniref:Uncharacterized protein n=1 Tax=Tetranychus urticae TaxID=32264 RepID=T1L0U1_TETUR
MAIILGLLLSQSDPLEEEKLLSKLLGQITDTYRASLTLESSDEQLTALDEADYFDFHGTAKHKLSSYGVVKVAVIPDVLLEDLPKKTIQNLKNEINSITQTFIPILMKKQRSPDSSRMQKLAVFLASQELQLLTSYSCSPAYNNYYHTDLTDSRKFAFVHRIKNVRSVR